MRHTSLASLRSVISSTCLLFLCVFFRAPSARALNFNDLRCNGPVVNFEEISQLFDVIDSAGNNIEWGLLSDCGEAANYTNGSGNTLCVAPGFGSPNYDTFIRSNTFTLRGATSAVLRFRLNYQDIAAGGDRFDVDISTNGSGGPWSNLASYDLDVGAFRVVGSGVLISLPLGVYLGESDVAIRFRYLDSGAAPDNGAYVQVDDLRVECVGGADLQAGISFSQPTVIEGGIISYTLTSQNLGTQGATDVAGMATVPPGFSLVGTAMSQGIPGPPLFGSDSAGASFGSILSGNSASLTMTTRAGMFPEVEFDVLTPPGIAGSYEVYGSLFGPPISAAQPLTGLVVLANDGVVTTLDACEPLINGADVAGRIALVEETGACSNDQRVKNVQDAGAIGAIVIGDSGILPVSFPVSDFYFSIFSSLKVMRPSGLVPTPITIPSVLVSLETGTVLKNNVVNSIQVRISGVPVLAQEQRVFGFTAGNEFDPDFGSIFPGIFIESDTDNTAIGTITVLKDSDGDGSADINESCPSDPLKVSSGICGCGVTDADANGNGIIDCVTSDELKLQISRAQALLKSLKVLRLSGNIKKDKARRLKQKGIKADLETAMSGISQLVANQSIPVVTASATTDLALLAANAEKSVRRAFRTGSSKFRALKKKGGRALVNLRNGIA